MLLPRIGAKQHKPPESGCSVVGDSVVGGTVVGCSVEGGSVVGGTVVGDSVEGGWPAIFAMKDVLKDLLIVPLPCGFDHNRGFERATGLRYWP